MSASFLSLPTAIYISIWDYCGPKDIMALASTCCILNTEIEKCVLVVDAKHDVRDLEEIPVFFADKCHSVFMECSLDFHSKVGVLSRKRNGSFDFDTVWEADDHRHDHFEFAFRNDPCREYEFFGDNVYFDGANFSIWLRKQFMTSEVTPAMKRALSACLNMGTSERVVWYPIKENLKQHEMTRLFMKLFLFACKSMSEESSPIRSFFESGVGVDDSDICLIPQIINLLEQILEQKEPVNCVTRPLSAEEIERYSWRPAEGIGTRTARSDKLPEIRLEPKFTWKQCKRKHLDQEDDNQGKDDLVFIARIPLVPNTTRISLRVKANKKADSSKGLFVIFFQRRQTGLECLENPIEGYVFHGDEQFWYGGTEFDVEPGDDACFLYFVPCDAIRLKLTGLKVCLHVVGDKHNEDLEYWIRMLLEGYYRGKPSYYHHLLPIILLRAAALAIREPDQEQNTELKNAFDTAKLDLTPEDLECMVEVCNVLLEELSRHGENVSLD